MTLHPVAPLQAAMLAASGARPGAYVQQVELTFPPGTDPARIIPAFQALARRFPALRQRFQTGPSGPPGVLENDQAGLELTDEAGPAPGGPDWVGLLATDRCQPVAGHRLRLWRESRRVLWTFHHALLDGRSTARLLRAWIDDVRGDGRDPGVPWVPWTPPAEGPASEVLHRWAAAFPPEEEEPPPPRGPYHAMACPLNVAVAAAARALDTGVHTLAQVTAALVVGRLLDRDHVVLGQVRACSPDAGAVGFWINTVPLVVSWSPEDGLRGLAGRVRDSSRALRDHARLAPGAWLAQVRPRTRQPWDAILMSEHGTLEELVGRPGVRIALHERSDDPLVLAAYLGREPRLQVESTVLPPPLVAWIAEAWRAAFEAVAQGPDATCGSVVPGGSDVGTPAGDGPPTIPAAFAATVAAQAARPAWVAGVRSRTYAELDADARRLAEALRCAGVAAGDRVAVLLRERTLLPAVLLAVPRAGAVFVPLDPDHPAGRWEAIWQDARPRLLVSDEAPWRKGLVRLDPRETGAPAAGADPTGQGVPVAPGAVAALLYTSGSTGTPKGVRLAGGAMVAEARAIGRLTGIRPDDRVLQFASAGFDACLEEVFLALLHGAALVPRGPGALADFEVFTRFIGDQAVTVADLPTAFWRGWSAWLARQPARFPGSLRVVIIGGEAATEASLAHWRAAAPAACQLWNTYGPTEATIVATAHPLHGLVSGPAPEGDPPIGKPLDGVTIRVAGADGTARPPGLPGELWIAGEGVSPGYWERPDLDAVAFVRRDGRRWYRTGDRAAWNEAGDLVFLGRLDDQIKLRGQRLEPDEIRRHIERVAGVQAAHVGLAGDPPMLVAWTVAPGAEAGLGERVREALATVLPAAMVPGVVMVLDALPLTSRGKVDRRRLPVPPAAPAAPAAEDPMVAWACRVFAGVLRREPREVDPALDFQRQGGDSILAMELVLRLREAGLGLEAGDLARDSSPRAIARRFSDPAARPPERWEPLVVLRPGREGVPPLVVIHSTPGDVLGYGNLAAGLPDDLPCWGLVSRALHEPARAHRSIPEMARDYLEVLRTRLGDAPFALGGWCYGGVVAYEMACALRRAGRPPPLRLLLIETACPPPAAWLPKLRWRYLQLRTLLTLRPDLLLGYLRSKAGLRPVATPLAPAPTTPRRDATLARNMEAVGRYRAHSYPGHVDLFLASPTPDVLPVPDGGWPVLAPHRTVYAAAGTHADLLRPPHVAGLAAQLTRLLLPRAGAWVPAGRAVESRDPA